MKELLLAAATSADIFAAVLGLRAAGIRLPGISAAAAAASGAVILWVSALTASALSGIFPVGAAGLVSKAILAVIGTHMIICGVRRISVRRIHDCRKDTGDILSCPESADKDRSNSISLKEGAAMGLALSADSVVTGISAGIGGASPAKILIFSLLFGLAACAGGIFAGNALRRRIKNRFPAEIIAGSLLVLIAVIQ